MLMPFTALEGVSDRRNDFVKMTSHVVKRDSASWITHHPAIGSCIVCGFEGLEICPIKGLHFMLAVRR